MKQLSSLVGSIAVLAALSAAYGQGVLVADVAKGVAPGEVTVQYIPASDEAFAIRRVEFFLNRSYRGSDSTFPFTRQFSNLAQNAYLFGADVYFNDGRDVKTASTIAFIGKERVRIRAKVRKRRITAFVNTSQSLPGDVTRVEWRLNRVYRGASYTSPFRARFVGLDPSRYRVQATVVYSSGDETDVSSKRLRVR